MLLVQTQGAIASLSFPSKTPKRWMLKKAYRPSLEVRSRQNIIIRKALGEASFQAKGYF